MFYYHESETDEIRIDQKPLLGETKLAELIKNEINPIYVNECYFKRTSMAQSYQENESVELSLTSSQVKQVESDCLYGLFVISFDTRLGNTIEWQVPGDLNLENIEFKAMCSGFHLMENDLVYFCKENMYGLAAFASLRLSASHERNCRMKSVGILAKSFKSLRKYVSFLQHQVKHQLETSGDYRELIQLWKHKKLFNQPPIESVQRLIVSNETSFLEKLFNKHLKLSQKTYNEGQFYMKFVAYFGPSLFGLWRCVLLNKRVLFYATPPIAELCYRVYCASQMGNTSFNFASSKQLIRPFFYVCVTDIDALQNESFYIACTSEKILETKQSLFDIFVDERFLNAVNQENQKNLLHVTSNDKRRFELLMKKFSNKMMNHEEEEKIFIQFFTEINDQIFAGLFDEENKDLDYFKSHILDKNNNPTVYRIKRSLNCVEQPKLVSNEVIKRIGLDPSDDKEFLNELIRFYDFNLKTS